MSVLPVLPSVTLSLPLSACVAGAVQRSNYMAPSDSLSAPWVLNAVADASLVALLLNQVVAQLLGVVGSRLKRLPQPALEALPLPFTASTWQSATLTLVWPLPPRVAPGALPALTLALPAFLVSQLLWLWGVQKNAPWLPLAQQQAQEALSRVRQCSLFVARLPHRPISPVL